MRSATASFKSATGGANINPSGLTVTSNGYNISDDNFAGLLTAAGDQPNTEPLLAPLADNGGPTPTHALLSGSPAINAGNDALAVDANNQPLTTDQRGANRIYGSSVDIGAFELDPDTDGDGIRDFSDNCPNTYNPDQADSNNNGIGDVCEDTTPPVITPDVSGTLGNNGWYTSNVEVLWSVVDAESSVSNSDGCGMQTVDYDTESVTFTCSATSAGGSDSNSVTIKRDATAPTLNPAVTPNPVLLGGSAAASPNASDALSGIASETCDAPNTSSVGFKSAPCSATDLAGNTANADADYQVVYNFAGFFQPIENLPTVNEVKAGQAIPIKFSLSGYQGMAIFAPGYPASSPVACEANEPGNTIDEISTPGSSGLNYSAGSDQYSYNWKTDKSWKGTCRILVIKLNDGSERLAKFRFK